MGITAHNKKLLEWFIGHAEDFSVEEWNMFFNQIGIAARNVNEASNELKPESQWYLSNFLAACSRISTKRGGMKSIKDVMARPEPRRKE